MDLERLQRADVHLNLGGNNALKNAHTSSKFPLLWHRCGERVVWFMWCDSGFFSTIALIAQAMRDGGGFIIVFDIVGGNPDYIRGGVPDLWGRSAVWQKPERELTNKFFSGGVSLRPAVAAQLTCQEEYRDGRQPAKSPNNIKGARCGKRGWGHTHTNTNHGSVQYMTEKSTDIRRFVAVELYLQDCPGKYIPGWIMPTL